MTRSLRRYAKPPWYRIAFLAAGAAAAVLLADRLYGGADTDLRSRSFRIRQGRQRPAALVLAGSACQAGPAEASEQPDEEEVEVPSAWLPSQASDAVPRKVSPTRYRVHTAAGAPSTGELHWHCTGLLGAGDDVKLGKWLLEYKKSLPSVAARLRGWQPHGRMSVSEGGLAASMRWSKELLPGEGAAKQTELAQLNNEQADGSGLDVHLQTSLEAPRSADAPQKLEQRAEVVVGPRAQAKYLNFSLPMGVLLGAVASQPAEQPAEDELPGSEGPSLGPVRFYAQLHWPGVKELRGWLAEAVAEQRWMGALSGLVQRPWSGKGDDDAKTEWYLQHVRSHGAVALPRVVGEGLSAVSSFLEDRLGGSSTSAPRLAPHPAVVPATKFRMGSDGPGATLGLASSQSGLGGSGWNGIAEVGRQGWGAKLALTLGVADDGLGQPRYAITAHAPWGGRTSLQHELKWTFTDGQWVGVTVQDAGPGRPPRVNLGVEVR